MPFDSISCNRVPILSHRVAHHACLYVIVSQINLDDKIRYDANYWWSSSQWVPTSDYGVVDRYMGTNQQYIAYFQQVYGYQPSVWEAHGTAGAVTLQIAIEQANSTNAADLRQVSTSYIHTYIHTTYTRYVMRATHFVRWSVLGITQSAEYHRNLFWSLRI
jgi:hypothetical protein